MRRFAMLLAALVFSVATAHAAPKKFTPGFTLDVGYGKVMVNAQSENTDDIFAARLDYRSGPHFAFTGGLARQTADDAYDYQLSVGLETHVFGRSIFDPYFSTGVAVHEVDVDNTSDDSDYATWHLGAGLDIHFNHEVGLAIDGRLARPFDQADGEERIEITAGLIIGG